MTLAEAIRNVVKEYVSEHGRDDVVTRQLCRMDILQIVFHFITHSF